MKMGYEEESQSFKSTSSSGVGQMSGYLFKKSSAGEWQKRYFETNGNYLTYYKSSKMTKLLAALAVPQVGTIKLIGESDDDKGGLGYIFQIELKDRQYLLRATTEDEAKRWVDFLIQIRDGANSSGKISNPMNSLNRDSRNFVETPKYSDVALEPRTTFQKSIRNKFMCCFGL